MLLDVTLKIIAYLRTTTRLRTLSLKAQKIKCCEVGCMLNYKDDIDLIQFKFCHLPQFLPPKVQKGRFKKVSLKRIFYLSIIPILQRLYAYVKFARDIK